ncbi:hypothetical protein ACJRO7_015219 [Eucalyptus globulus]|uniref:Uncharacterized protein n=1 Tax=Eucalyptus globulus TaxID=34317 RepID=A0ABD3L6P5_EUCGL
MPLEIKDNQAALRDKIAVLRAEFFEEIQTMQVILDAKVNSIQGEYGNMQGKFDGLKENMNRMELGLGNYMAKLENKINILKCYDPVRAYLESSSKHIPSSSK